MLATLALPERYLAQTVAAVSKAKKPVLVWLQFQDCTGCSESMLRSSHPDVADIVLDLLSWEYHEVIMAGAGSSRQRACSIAWSRRTKASISWWWKARFPRPRTASTARSAARPPWRSPNRCAATPPRPSPWAPALSTAGWCASKPNPTGALGVQEAVPGIKVINMAGCPHNPANTAAVLVHYLTFNDLPALDQYNRPLFAYGRVIHDQCERRAHYDAGRFVTEWGDEGHRKGWCLYKMGCKGPAATFNCPDRAVERSHQLADPRGTRLHRLRFARGSGTTCRRSTTGCRRVPGFGVEVTAGEIGLGLTGAVVAGVTAHGLIKMIKPAPKPEAPRSEARKED